MGRVKGQKTDWDQGVRHSLPITQGSLNTPTTLRCSKCKFLGCEFRERSDRLCPIELGIREAVTELAESYGLEDAIQLGLLATLADLFVKRWRCEMALAEIGIVYEEVVNVARDGTLIKNLRANPLLKAVNDIERNILSYIKELKASPASKDDGALVDNRSVIINVMRRAQELRNSSNNENLGVNKLRVRSDDEEALVDNLRVSNDNDNEKVVDDDE